MYYDKETCKLSQAYLFTELYNKGFIKSKAFTFTSDAQSLQTKIMYIIKSSVNKAIADNNLNDVFNSTSFSYNTFKTSVLLDNMYGKSTIFKSRANNIINNAAIDLNNILIVSLSGLLFRYSFSNIYQIFNPYAYNIDSTKFNLKDELDTIINCIMFVPTSIVMIGNLVKEIEKIDSEYQFTLTDIYDYIRNISLYGSGSQQIISIKDIINNKISTDGIESLDNIIIDIPEAHRNNMHKLNSGSYYLNEEALNLINYIKEEVEKLNGTK